MKMAIKNSEILFLYDAKMTNPNGDLDNANKPRMDYETDTNLVSDVRLKRYIRDYLEHFENEDLFISNKYENSKEAAEKLKKKGKEQKDCKDVKFFGAVLADKGANTHFTGPIQFNWGYSLNKVELNESKSITSSFNGGEGIGKDYRVKYSFIAFSGNINSKNAENLELNQEDINLFDKAMIRSIPLAKTRSKIGQTPRLYLRIELKDDKSFLKDLRDYTKLDKNEVYNSIEDIKLNLSKLKEYIEKNKEKIYKIYYFIDESLNIDGIDFNDIIFEKLEF
jgi:CRISPR-associated protein Csh2